MNLLQNKTYALVNGSVEGVSPSFLAVQSGGNFIAVHPDYSAGSVDVVLNVETLGGFTDNQRITISPGGYYFGEFNNFILLPSRSTYSCAGIVYYGNSKVRFGNPMRDSTRTISAPASSVAVCKVSLTNVSPISAGVRTADLITAFGFGRSITPKAIIIKDVTLSISSHVSINNPNNNVNGLPLAYPPNICLRAEASEPAVPISYFLQCLDSPVDLDLDSATTNFISVTASNSLRFYSQLKYTSVTRGCYVPYLAPTTFSGPIRQLFTPINQYGPNNPYDFGEEINSTGNMTLVALL